MKIDFLQKTNINNVSFSGLKAKTLSAPTKHINKKGVLLGLMALASVNMTSLNTKVYAQQPANYIDLGSVDAPTSPLHDKFGNYGDYFYANIPQGENKEQHIALINEISSIYKEINGCEYKNPAVFNGMKAGELEQKVLKPAKMMQDGQKLPEYQNNLIFIVAENSTNLSAFNANYKNSIFTAKSTQDGFTKYNFDESFFEHYDNIIVVQPNDQKTFDDVMDKTMAKFENIVGGNNTTDVIYMAHGCDENSAVISAYGSADKRCINVSDFKPVEEGGNTYAQSLKNIFAKGIEDCCFPKVIGMGCSSDFLQECIDTMMGEDSFFVKVFGTPYRTHGANIIGYNKGKLNYFVSVSPYKNKFSLDIKLSDEKASKDAKKVNSFLLNLNNLAEYMLENFNNELTSETISKPNGVSMEYETISCY